MKKNKLFFNIFAIILVILNIFVFPNMNGPYIELNIIILVLNIIYFIYCFKKKKLLINKKVDLLVILFILSSVLPLFFDSTVSLYDQYNRVMQNLTLLIFYVFVRNISYKNEQKIINILIYSSVPVILIAFDRINFNFIWNILSKIKLFKVIYEENGILANFNYPNSLAIYISAISIILLSQIINKKNKLKYNIICNVYFSILFTTIMLTLSKASIILYFITILIYILFNNKEDKKIIIKLLLISIFTIIVEASILLFISNTLLKVLLQILLLVILIGLNYHKITDKFNLKKIFIAIGIVLSVSIVYIVNVINFSKPINIYGEKSFETNNIINKQNYKIAINLDAKKNNNNINNFNIKIYAIYKDGSSTEVIDDSFEKYSGKKEYDIIVSKDVYFLRFTFNNIDIYNDNDFIIDNILIDDKEFIINYKLLPNFIGNMFSNNFFNSRSLLYRKEYYKNAYYILKDNTIFGLGASSWKYLYIINRTFDYGTSESHSYLIDTFLDFGIISVILLILIYILLFKNLIKIIKNKDKDYKITLAINLSVLLILIHSLMDFNMSFLLIKYLVFILIIILSNFDNKDNIKEYKSIYIISFLVTIILLILNIFNLSGVFIYNKYLKIQATNYNEYLEHSESYLKTALKFYPYNKFIRYENIIINKSNNNNLWGDLFNLKEDEKNYNRIVIYKLLSKEIYKELKEGNVNIKKIQTLDDCILYEYIYSKYDIGDIINRTELLKNLFDNYNKYYVKNNNKKLKDEIDKIYNKILDEYEINKVYISDKTSTKYKVYQELVDEISNYKKGE